MHDYYMTNDDVENFLPSREEFFYGYMRMCKEILPDIEKMLQEAKSFEELKTELTLVLQDRKQFLDVHHDKIFNAAADARRKKTSCNMSQL